MDSLPIVHCLLAVLGGVILLGFLLRFIVSRGDTAPFSLFLALRYLKPKRSFVSVITVISVLGVALGVMILVVVIAVFTGYQVRIKQTILSFEPHLVVDSSGVIYDWPQVAEKVRAVPGVVSVIPFGRGQVILDAESPVDGFKHRQAVQMRAFQQPEDGQIKYEMIGGAFDLNDANIILGDELAAGLRLGIGDTVTVFSPNIDDVLDAIQRAEQADTAEDKAAAFDFIREATIPQDLTVAGVFNSGHYDFDSSVVFLPLYIGQELYNLADGAHGLAVETEDGYRAHKTRRIVEQQIGPGYRVLSWMQMHQHIFDAVAAERQVMYFILLFLMIVAGFCIMNTMITVTYQKRAEIGLMKAIGGTENQIASLFLVQGIIVGLFGVVVGLALAALVVEFRGPITEAIGSVLGIDVFTESVYKIEGGLPAKVTYSDTLLISLGAFIACTIASFIPALMAARLQPAEALRSE